jgi:hypothetical protein
MSLADGKQKLRGGQGGSSSLEHNYEGLDEWSTVGRNCHLHGGRSGMCSYIFRSS